MRTMLSATLILALSACSPAERKKRAPEPVATTVPASYQVYPQEVRAEIYQWDLLSQKCGGRFRSNGGAVCGEADALRETLLKKGWCFGGADDPANAHWVLCAEDYPGAASWIASPVEAQSQDQ